MTTTESPTAYKPSIGGKVFAFIIYSLPGLLVFLYDSAHQPPRWVIATIAGVAVSLLFRASDR